MSESEEDGPISEIARRIGEDPEEMLEGATTPEAKQALTTATTEALGRGVFGVPTLFVGYEMFWGSDRLCFVKEALQQG